MNVAEGDFVSAAFHLDVAGDACQVGRASAQLHRHVAADLFHPGLAPLQVERHAALDAFDLHVAATV